MDREEGREEIQHTDIQKERNEVSSSDYEKRQRQDKTCVMPETYSAAGRQLQDTCDDSVSGNVSGDTANHEKKRIAMPKYFKGAFKKAKRYVRKTDMKTEKKDSSTLPESCDRTSDTKTGKRDSLTSPEKFERTSDKKTGKRDSPASLGSFDSSRPTDTHTGKRDSSTLLKSFDRTSYTKRGKRDSLTSPGSFDRTSDKKTGKRDSPTLPKTFDSSRPTDTNTGKRDSSTLPKSFDSLQIFGGPMCLISTNARTGKFEINTDVLDQIKEIDSPLVVVAIAGLYRTGKSYLMNRLAGSTSGFPLGNTTQSKTKGIWVWCRPHPTKEKYVLLLLDTEGMGDAKKGDTGHDNKIFTLAALLCNVLIYNMMNVWNQDAVEKLTFITEISNNINFKGKSEKNIYGADQLALILPTFVLCLRDFSLELEQDGVNITADQYLEDFLELRPEKDESDQKYNRPRKCIRTYFPNRKCFTFDRPGDREVMKRLDKVQINDLSQSFIEDSDQFIGYINNCKGKVLLSSKPVKGIMFASLVESYVLSIQNGGVPDVDDAIKVVSRIENKRVADAAVNNFTQQLKRIKLPIFNKEQFDQQFQSIQKSSLEEFRIEAMFESEQFEKEAARKMEDIWKETTAENLKLTRKHCSDLVQRIYDESIKEPMHTGKYYVSGGYAVYKLDIEELKTSYKHRTKHIDCVEVQQALHSFLDTEGENERKILQADQKLTKADRNRQLGLIQEANKKAQREQQRLFDRRINEEKERSKRMLSKMETDRQAYAKQEDEKMKILMEQWRDQKELREKQIEMMTTQNEKQREEFKSEINKMKAENLLRDQENQRRFEKLLENEQAKYKQQLDDMNDTLRNLTEIEQQRSEKYEKEVEMYRNDLQKTKQEKEAERERHKTKKRKLKQEKKLAEEQVALESKEKQRVLDEKQIVIFEKEHLQREKDITTRENDRLQRENDAKEREKQQLCQEKNLIELEKEYAENKIERLKKRGIFKRLFNKDV